MWQKRRCVTGGHPYTVLEGARDTEVQEEFGKGIKKEFSWGGGAGAGGGACRGSGELGGPSSGRRTTAGAGGEVCGQPWPLQSSAAVSVQRRGMLAAGKATGGKKMAHFREDPQPPPNPRFCVRPSLPISAQDGLPYCLPPSKARVNFSWGQVPPAAARGGEFWERTVTHPNHTLLLSR